MRFIILDWLFILLIVKGVDINAKNRGKQLLEWVVNYNLPEFDFVADLLRKHGGKTGEKLEAEGKQNTSYSEQSFGLALRDQLWQGPPL